MRLARSKETAILLLGSRGIGLSMRAMAPLDKLRKLIDLPATAGLPRRFPPRQEISSRAANCRINMLNPDLAASGDVS